MHFITVDANEVPQFPYILGVNYYSLPVDSNYNSNISQDDIPVGLKALRSSLSERNGSQFSALIQDVKKGNISSGYVESSTNNFSPGNTVYVNNTRTEGEGTVVTVDHVTGVDVTSIECNDTKASQVKIQESGYLFAGDQVNQTAEDGTVASGDLIEDVINADELVLRNVTGSFNTTTPIDSESM